MPVPSVPCTSHAASDPLQRQQTMFTASMAILTADVAMMNSEVALITGASSGIGLHLASEFARNGHPLVLVAPDRAELEAIATDLVYKYGNFVRVVPKDL